ncbi:MAG: sigma-70 family RNA polymerase sigma factor [Planctomycetes bacterium]|jgi:RNA polymerase sigma-70 factor (ECF subfamily)|nr:sigma-70 family RNA polymerase sigma factor [Planctomycetota bacterium]
MTQPARSDRDAADHALDAAFAAFAGTGEPRQLARVFDATAGELLAVARFLVADPHAAEDLVQQTFLQAIEHRHRYDPTRPVLPWLLGILSNAARRERRRRGRPEPVRPPASLASPIAAAATAESDARLREALRGMPQPYREVLTLQLEHGLDAAQIAAATGRPTATVRKQFARGLELLRRALPIGFGAALAAALPAATTTARLDFVRRVVLHRAAGITLPAATGLTLLPVLAMSKLSLAAAVAFAALLTVLLWPHNGSTAAPTAVAGANATPPQAPVIAAAAAAPERTAAQPVATSAARLRVALAFDDGGPPPRIRQLRAQLLVGNRSALGVEPLADADATFVVDAPPGWTQLGFVIDELDGDHHERVAAASDVEPDGLLRLVLQRAVGLCLRVVDAATGAPVPGARLIARREPPLLGPAEPTADLAAVADASGIAIFRTARMAPHRLRGDGGLRVLGPLRATPDPSGRPLEVRVAPASDWSVHGRVIAAADGAGIAEVAIEFLGEVVAHTDADGRFELPGSLRSRGLQTAARIAARPRADSAFGPATGGPFAWGDREVRIELGPRAHEVEVLDTDGMPHRAAIAWRPAPQLGRPNPWQPLAALGPGRHLLPPEYEGFGIAWLRLDEATAAPHAGGRFVVLRELPTTVRSDAVVHRWQLAAPAPCRIVVRHGDGRPLGGIQVEALLAQGPCHPPTAQLVAELDPSEANPFVGNLAVALGSGTTDADGELQLRLPRTFGAGVRAQAPHHVAAWQAYAGEPRLLLTLPNSGSLRGRLHGAHGKRLVLANPPTRSIQNVVVQQEQFVVDGLRPGTWSVLQPLPGHGGQPHVHLGDVVITAGETAEFVASAGFDRTHRVRCRSRDLLAGDRLHAIDVRLGGTVATTTVERDGEVEFALTAGRYRLRRERADADRGGATTCVFAAETLRVHSDATEFVVTVPEHVLRLRLLDGDGPAASTWVRTEPGEDIHRTDRDGWLVLTAPEPGFALVAVQHGHAGWRPSGMSWRVQLQDDGTELRRER